MEENRNSDSGSHESADNFFALSVPKSDESFPMLKAFQEFLDAERERARRRQMILATSFMAALVVVVVLFCGIGAVLFSGMVTRGDAKQDKLLEMLLSQRAEAQPSAVVAAPAPRVEPDPVIKELMAVLQQLRAETAELKAAAAAAEAEKSIAASAPEVPEVKPEAPAKKTGVFSSPKRRTESVPAPTPTEIEPVSGTSDEGSPSTSDTVAASPVAAPPVIAPPAAAPKSDPNAPVLVKVVPSRAMQLPEGYEANEMSVVTEGNVKFPWRILMPTGAEIKDDSK